MDVCLDGPTPSILFVILYEGILTWKIWLVGVLVNVVDLELLSLWYDFLNFIIVHATRVTKLE